MEKLVENNPYNPPKSQLITDRSVGKSVMWWLYFALLLLMLSASLVMHYLSNSLGQLSLFSTTIDLFCIVGLFGYIKTKRILTDLFWVVIFIVEVVKLLMGTSLFFYNYITSTYDTNERLVALIGSFSFILALPLCYALWRYTFKTPSLWVPEKNQR